MVDNKIIISIKQKLPGVKMLSFILAFITIITCVKLHQNSNDKFWKKVCVMIFGLLVGAAICGMIINMFYNDKIRKMYNTSVFLGNIANITAHIIPLILILIYAPKNSPIEPKKIIIFSFLILCLYMSLFDFRKVYPGVPLWVFGLYPFIIILSVLIKYRHNRIYEIENFNNYKKRAIVVYVPNKKKYIKELKNVYKSCKYNKLFKNTDLIVFGEKELKRKINSRCIFIEVEDVEKKNNWYRDLYGGHYSFMNSIDIFLDKKAKFLEN